MEVEVKIYRAIDVANFIIEYCGEHKKWISNLTLQKLLYFTQAEFLVTKRTPCFYEPIKACDFGVMIKEVYFPYLICGGAAIFAPLSRLKSETSIAEEDKKIIISIVDEMAEFSNSQLNEIVFRQDPWIKAYSVNDKTITLTSLYKFFKD